MQEILYVDFIWLQHSELFHNLNYFRNFFLQFTVISGKYQKNKPYFHYLGTTKNGSDLIFRTKTKKKVDRLFFWLPWLPSVWK